MSTREILPGYTDAQVRELADTPTPQPMAGTWTLMAPDGQSWTGDTPLRCVGAEQKARVPALVALARIKQSLLDEQP